MTYFLKSGAIVPIRQKGEAYIAEVAGAVTSTGVADALEVGTPSRSHFLADAAMTFFVEILEKKYGKSAAAYARARSYSRHFEAALNGRAGGDE